METSGAYWKGCALQAAVGLDIFSILADQKLAAEDVARKIKADTDGIKRLLEALAAMDLIEKDGSLYANSRAARKWLCRDSEAFMGYMILHHYQLIQSWCLLDQAVRDGRPKGPDLSFDDPKWRENFLMGMFNTGMLTAPLVARTLDLKGREYLLDLGGGPGTYSIYFCLENPGLRADIFDLPTSEPFAWKSIERFGLGGRIGFVGGDYNSDDLPSGYDVVWISHIFHSMGPEGCRMLLEKAGKALADDGMLAIHDFILNDQQSGPLFPALFSLNMLLRTENGRSYSQSELAALMQESGFRDIERLEFCGPNDSGIMIARK